MRSTDLLLIMMTSRRVHEEAACFVINIFLAFILKKRETL